MVQNYLHAWHPPTIRRPMVRRFVAVAVSMEIAHKQRRHPSHCSSSVPACTSSSPSHAEATSNEVATTAGVRSRSLTHAGEATQHEIAPAAA